MNRCPARQRIHHAGRGLLLELAFECGQGEGDELADLWFANAIMAGHDWVARNQWAKTAALEQERDKAREKGDI